ncbi:hypothetical protein WH5701_12353 [Synechococcus sp. WH 5701]|nr:hypothetical protein WH5701_12353 [Synechococcus sp. WH 5701]
MSAFVPYTVVRVPFPFTDRQAQKQRGCGHLLPTGT